jgi:N-ethylmaleimide reductase
MNEKQKLHLLLSGSIGPYRLHNRIVMAPLTRMRAGAGNRPTAMNAEYYRQRASAGLIISEATPVSPFGYGYKDTPGIHTTQQIEGWKLVTRAVHDVGGRVFLQLWHVGRMSHPALQPGRVLPVAPSAIAPEFTAPTPEGPQKAVAPRALGLREVANVVSEFRLGAQYAMEAGFDGVEIHGANGYLLEQFLSDNSNHRTDQYGGSIENRARFFLEVTDAVQQVWGPERVGVRISPSNTYGGIHMSQRWETFSYLVQRLNNFELAYIHLVEPSVSGSADVDPQFDLGANRFRPLISGTTKLISAGGHTRESGNRFIKEGWADFIAYGRHFLANPDLPRRFALNAKLNAYDRSTFYGGTEKGYLDYPVLAESLEREAALP